MAFLGRGRKADLIKLANNLELTLTGSETILQLKDKIVSDENFDSDFVENMFEAIINERLEEAERQIQRENAELARQDRLRQENFEQTLKQKQLELQHEIDRLRAQNNTSETRTESARGNTADLKLNKLIQKFDPENADISLYLVIFERQAKRAKIDKAHWVSNLISLLPIDIIQIIARESEEFAEDYDHVKKILLKRFKMSAEGDRKSVV